MYQKEVFVQNACGLHARPAALFCKAAAEYAAEITVVNCSQQPQRQGNAKSILSVLSLCAVQGSRLCIFANGTDEKAAVDTLVALVQQGLGEAPQHNCGR